MMLYPSGLICKQFLQPNIRVWANQGNFENFAVVKFILFLIIPWMMSTW